MNPVTTDDGLALHLRTWPAANPTRGVAVLVHGLGEHVDRYDHVARRLNGLGFTVVGYDHRGHGRSPGQRGAIPADDTLCADLGRVLRAARESVPGPLTLVGHSLGGLIAGRFVAEGLSSKPAPWWCRVDALVMSSPALDPGTNAIQKLLLAVVASMLSNLAVNNGLKVDWISRDAGVVKAYAGDPLVHDRITARTTRFIVDAGARVIADAPRWALRTLLMWAGADRCVAPRGSEAFASAVPANVVATRPWPDLFHEIFNEPEKAEVLKVLTDWLNR